MLERLVNLGGNMFDICRAQASYADVQRAFSDKAMVAFVSEKRRFRFKPHWREAKNGRIHFRGEVQGMGQSVHITFDADTHQLDQITVGL